MFDNESFYKENLSFKSIFYFCSLPLRLDSYKGCFFNCLYCFSQSLNNRKDIFFNHKPLPANPDKFQNLLESLETRDHQYGVVRSCLKRRVPIHFGSVSDPFQHSEIKFRISYKFLQILKRFNYPTVISTKGTLISTDEYLDLLKQFPVVVQNSFSTFNTSLATEIEPYAPLPIERLKSLELLAKGGIWTSARIQPFLYPLEKVKDIDFKSLSNAGIKHVVLEHLRIPTNSSIRSRNKLFQSLGMNMLQAYEDIGIKYSRVNYELISKVKLENILEAKEIANQYGLTFGSADNDFHHISDSPCCCGLPQNDDFLNYYKGNIGYSLYQSMRSNSINFDNIDDEWQPSGSISEFINSDGRRKSVKTTTDFLKMKINDPISANSPSSFGGISFDNEKGYIIDKELRTKFFEREDKNENL